MSRHFIVLLLLTLSSPGNANSWEIVPSVDAYWIKTNSQDQHQLVVIRKDHVSWFMLILATDSPPPGEDIPVKIKFDRSPPETVHLKFMDNRPEQSIFRIELSEQQKEIYISRMITGLKMTISFDKKVKGNREISFSLKGFTVALNDLLIADDIGSLDPSWLHEKHKDHELFCYLTSAISVKVMQQRIEGYNFSDSLHSIKQTGYSMIDNNLSSIISQIYNIPQNNLPSEPKAEKYMIFRRCMKQWQQQNQ